jgi:hypothetical protein
MICICREYTRAFAMRLFRGIQRRSCPCQRSLAGCVTLIVRMHQIWTSWMICECTLPVLHRVDNSGAPPLLACPNASTKTRSVSALSAQKARTRPPRIPTNQCSFGRTSHVPNEHFVRIRGRGCSAERVPSARALQHPHPTPPHHVEAHRDQEAGARGGHERRAGPERARHDAGDQGLRPARAAVDARATPRCVA